MAHVFSYWFLALKINVVSSLFNQGEKVSCGLFNKHEVS